MESIIACQPDSAVLSSSDMNTKPKVAYLLTSLAGGGAERNVMNLCLYDKPKDYISEIISLTHSNDYEEAYKKEERRNIVIHYMLPIKTKIPKYSIVLLFLLFLNLFSLLKKKKYRVLIGAVELYPYYISLIIAIFLRKKSILIVGNNLSQELKSTYRFSAFFHKILLICAFALTNKVICVSHGVEKDVIQNFYVSKKKIVVIYNGVDTQKIEILAKEKIAIKPLKNKTYLVACGRLSPKKGYFGLLKSFSLVLRYFPDLYLVIIGKGPLAEDLMKFTKLLKIDRRVFFLGFEGKNPYKIVSKATLFLFSSLYEGFGNVLIEAMSCGVPVISTDCLYGPKEICGSGKYCVLTPPFQQRIEKSVIVGYEEKAYAKKIIDIVSNEKLRKKYSELSKKRAENFTIQKMAAHYHHVIQDML